MRLFGGQRMFLQKNIFYNIFDIITKHLFQLVSFKITSIGLHQSLESLCKSCKEVLHSICIKVSPCSLKACMEAVQIFVTIFTNIPGPVWSLRVHPVCFWRGWRPISLGSNLSKCYLFRIWMHYVLTKVRFFGALNRWSWILFVHGLNNKDELMNTKVVKKYAWICKNWLQSIHFLPLAQPQPASIKLC